MQSGPKDNGDEYFDPIRSQYHEAIKLVRTPVYKLASKFVQNKGGSQRVQVEKNCPVIIGILGHHK